jgi:hypothetical protein
MIGNSCIDKEDLISKALKTYISRENQNLFALVCEHYISY